MSREGLRERGLACLLARIRQRDEVAEQLLEKRVMQAYVKLNQEGRDKVMDLMEDFGQIKKYKAK